ncbi:MAG: LuxR C-terminal-related transcriptional regulator [Saprospiraceae bacterium]|nr:LuxR C-terminal-related transcriptional regulator [Saprospiraceae bacterium]
MSRTVILYGIGLALLMVVLKSIEYRYMLRDLSMEFYITLVALLFTGIGVWVGIKLRNKTVAQTEKAAEKLESSSIPKEQLLARTGISQREFEVLELIAEGCTNQEIADRLFISLNTVKTHSSNLFAKLDVKRRTQAVQKAKELTLLG